ncbi:ribonuclease III [Listeria monocytogenes]|nr:ribonuclease III [Listeria monocytogenes]
MALRPRFAILSSSSVKKPSAIIAFSATACPFAETNFVAVLCN